MPPIRAPNRKAWMKEYKARQNYRKRKAGKQRAAVKIQRNFRRYKKMKYNKELKSLETITHTHTLQHQAASGSQMENGLLLYPTMWNPTNHSLLQGTTEQSILGTWITPVYLTQKFIVNWSSLTHHADLSRGLELRCRYGFITVSPYKADCSLNTAATWVGDVNKLVVKELTASHINDNHLTFSKKSRTVQILGDFMVRPNLNIRVADGHTGSTPLDFAPPNNLTIRWDRKKFFLKRKTRLTATADDPKQYVAHNQWIPFVYFSSNNITQNMGSLSIADSSKFYFSDN